MRVCAIVGVVSALTLASLDASAQDAEGPSHRGLFTRLAIGFGGAKAVNDGSPEVELSGPAGFFSFDLGGTLAERLVLHGRLSGHGISNPTVSLNGNELGEADDTSVTFSLLGVGLTYYFPSNWYLTGAVGLAGASFELDGEEYKSETGFGLAGVVGYEWWVGGDWGLGVAGRVELESVPNDPDRLVGKALGILFTATYH